MSSARRPAALILFLTYQLRPHTATHRPLIRSDVSHNVPWGCPPEAGACVPGPDTQPNGSPGRAFPGSPHRAVLGEDLPWPTAWAPAPRLSARSPAARATTRGAAPLRWNPVSKLAAWSRRLRRMGSQPHRRTQGPKPPVNPGCGSVQPTLSGRRPLVSRTVRDPRPSSSTGGRTIVSPDRRGRCRLERTLRCVGFDYPQPVGGHLAGGQLGGAAAGYFGQVVPSDRPEGVALGHVVGVPALWGGVGAATGGRMIVSPGSIRSRSPTAASPGWPP